MAARSQAEILDRYRRIRDDDWAGFRRDALASLMTADTINATGDYKPITDDEHAAAAPLAALRDYFPFACEKATDHRGISASRSVEKLTEFAWAAGFDDAVAAMDAAPYQNYGAPQLHALAQAVDGLVWPDTEALNNMSAGEPCQPGCEQGCGI